MEFSYTHLAGIIGAWILEVALLLGVDAVARLVQILVGAVEVDLLLLSDNWNGFSRRLASHLWSGLGQAEQQGCYEEQLKARGCDISMEYTQVDLFHLTVYCMSNRAVSCDPRSWSSAPSSSRSVTVANRGDSLHIYTKSLELLHTDTIAVGD